MKRLRALAAMAPLLSLLSAAFGRAEAGPPAEGNQAGASFGFSAAPAGDVSDDGFADVPPRKTAP